MAMTERQVIDELTKYFGFSSLTPEKLIGAVSRDLQAGDGANANVRALFINPVCADRFAEESVATTRTYVQRLNGKAWTLKDHVRGMVYAMLSNQRPWTTIQQNIQRIDCIFNNFQDVNWIKNQQPSFFVSKIKALSCGNRRIKKQMDALKDDISVLETIAADYGSVDCYFNRMCQNHQQIDLIKSLALPGEKYKLKEMGIALVCEYLKGMGVNVCKPDVHMLRFIGYDRMRWIPRVLKQGKPRDAIDAINQLCWLSAQTGYPAPFLDTLIWNFCRDDAAGLGICGANPNCARCPSRLKKQKPCWY